VTLLLTGGVVVGSLDPPRVIEADVAIEGDRIVAFEDAPQGATRRDCSGCLIVPGNVCAHTHLYSTLARGMPYLLPPPTNFLEILQRVWWRLDRALDEESIRASALVGGVEALRSGTTTLLDHHASPNAIDGSLDIIADALEELGLRSILCYEVTDRDGAQRALAGLQESGRFLREERSLTGGMVGAHASFTLSSDTLAACAEIAGAYRTGVHIHVAEDGVDQRDCQARFGRPVVQWLADANVLRPDALLAHCVHVAEAEAATIRQSAAAVAHNPRSNMNNKVGRAPVASLGHHVAFGTDGIDADMFAEARTGYFRLREEDLGTEPAWALGLLTEASAFAGQLLGEPGLGRIEPGAPADLVVLEYDPPTPLTGENLAGHWMFGLTAGHVRDVVVNGELVVADRRLTRVDQEKIAADAVAVTERLWQRLDGIEPHPFEPAGGT
jgi:putative selenium metabolism protein SsnA